MEGILRTLPADSFAIFHNKRIGLLIIFYRDNEIRFVREVFINLTEGIENLGMEEKEADENCQFFVRRYLEKSKTDYISKFLKDLNSEFGENPQGEL